jgi:amidase
MIRVYACAAAILTASLAAQTDASSVMGRWLLTADVYGTRRLFTLQLDGAPAHLSANIRGVRVSGALQAGHLHLEGSNDGVESATVDAEFVPGHLRGKVSEVSKEDAATEFTFTAEPVLPLTHTAQHYEFKPGVFYRQFSPFYAPVLKINPGDSVHTTTVDAGGVDANNIRRATGGNPQTGPFFINGAMPGDTLVIHINKLRLNRDWAGSDDSLVESALNSDLRWTLDRERNIATPTHPGEHMTHFAVPLKPMLGCIATADGPAAAPPGTGDSGSNGGNMDFNEIVEGATVYLPVSNPGALLYVGDGHAVMGDGEVTGNALETSMDVDFTVDVLPGKRIGGPRVETPQDFISMGLDGSLDDAFRDATSNMANWLSEDYKLTPSEIAQVLGVAAEYHVSEVADRNSGVTLKLKKSVLASLDGR